MSVSIPHTSLMICGKMVKLDIILPADCFNVATGVSTGGDSKMTVATLHCTVAASC